MRQRFKSVLWLAAFLAIGCTHSALANTRIDYSLIETTPHELALTQALSQICPDFLSPSDRKKFAKAYQMQLQSFMPTLDTKVVMQEIGSQPEYQKILQSMYRWTLSFPKEENRALCLEFTKAYF